MATSHVQQLLKQVTAVLPDSDEDLIYKGIAAGVSERMFALKKVIAQLQTKYGSLEQLELRIKAAGVSPDDHTLYTDVLEWRAAEHEIAQLLQLLESI
jgi:hypothetical protein